MAHVYVITHRVAHFVVADSEEHARAYYHENLRDGDEGFRLMRVDDSRALTVYFDDHEPDEPPDQTRTAAEWAAEGPSPSLLASTCW